MRLRTHVEDSERKIIRGGKDVWNCKQRRVCNLFSCMPVCFFICACVCVCACMRAYMRACAISVIKRSEEGKQRERERYAKINGEVRGVCINCHREEMKVVTEKGTEM